MNTDTLVRRYKEVYKRKTGKDLSDEEALDQAMKLVTLVEAVYISPFPTGSNGSKSIFDAGTA